MQFLKSNEKLKKCHKMRNVSIVSESWLKPAWIYNETNIAKHSHNFSTNILCHEISMDTIVANPQKYIWNNHDFFTVMPIFYHEYFVKE